MPGSLWKGRGGDRRDRSRILHCHRWRWAKDSTAQNRRQCGSRRRTCRGVPRTRLRERNGFHHGLL